MSKNLIIISTQVEDRAIVIHLSNGTELKFEDCWLRDHCRCPKCYHADTFQRANHILDIPDSRVKIVSNNDEELKITWDDNHQSTYDIEFLYDNDYQIWREERRFKPILWKGSEIQTKVARIHVDKFLNSVEYEKLVFQSLLDYGVALIEGVGLSIESTEKVCKAMGGVQHTLFGGMFSFENSAMHADTAYTSLAIDAHNDSTYFTESTGLLILHCLEHTNGTGGETILTDGFFGASKLKEEALESFVFLTTHNVEAEYIGDGHHHRYSAPIISVDPVTNDIKQIRFNVYDRSAMPLENGDDTRSYYRSLRNLSRHYQDPKNQWQFKLKPGLVMVIDNFRVLHARTSFTGKRELCGSYVARSDWLDRARFLNLLK